MMCVHVLKASWVRRLASLGAAIAAVAAVGFGLGRVRAAESGVDAKTAFASLKALAGEWQGPVGSSTGKVNRVIFRVTSGGSAVFERQFPDQPHEMTSVYHLDGEELVLTHYCAAGNQPRMRLNRAASTPSLLLFDFAGGSNLDPAKDGHVHAGRIRVLDAGRFEAEWYFHAEGKCVGTNGFFMTRAGR